MRRLFRLPWRSPGRIREDVDDEIAFHLEMRTKELVDTQGMEPEHARRQAEREFGDVREARRALRGEDERIERGARWRHWVDGLTMDLRFAVRSLLKRPGLTGLAVVTIALGIGVTTLVFSVVDGVLLKPLPYPDSDRLVNVWQTNESWLDSDNPMLQAFARRFPASYPVYEDWGSMVASFEAVGAYKNDELTLTGSDRPERVSAVRASAGVFQVLGVRPALGRVFSDAQDRIGGPALAVLSHGLWQRRFGGDRSVLGGTLTLEGTPHTVVGVMPPEFYFPDPESELWVTLDDEVRQSGRGSQGLRTIARLRPGVDLEAASGELDAVTARIAEAHPDTQGQLGARLAPRLDEVVGEVRPSLLILFAGAALVLLVACANLMNMLFVRATMRGREIAVRAALGAGRVRIARTMLAESAVLAVVGGGLGLSMALLLIEPLVAMLPVSIPRAQEVAVDWRTLGFAVAATVGAVLLAGVIPAVIAGRTRVSTALQAAGWAIGATRRKGRLQSALVVTELAAAVVMLVTAGLLGGSLVRMSQVDPGFDPDGVVVAELSPPAADYSDVAAVRGLYEQIRERLTGFPGVQAVGFAEHVPFFGGSSSGTVEVQTDEGESVTDDVAQGVVSDGYFDAFRVPLVEGRSFEPGDREDAAQVVVVSRAFAERHWPATNAVGRLLRDPPEQEWRRVVGVVDDVRYGSLTSPPTPRVYRPIAQAGGLEDGRLVMAVRTAGDPAGVVGALREAVWEVAPGTPIPRVVRAADAMAESVAEPRFRALLIGTLALLAALFAIAGVYALVAFRVTRRTSEMGVRMALGASPSRLTREVVAGGLRLAGLGLLVGVPAALGAGRLVRGFLFQVSGTSPSILIAAALVVAGTAGLAAYVPARRAARVDATVALKVE